MKSFSVLAGICLLGIANAVDMSQYWPAPGVESAFEPFLKELYLQTELLNANVSFTNFFTTDGRFTVLTYTGVGAAQILNVKYTVLPPSSGQIWSHRPNAVTVVSETATQKVYNVFGIIEKNFNGYMGVNNCSENFYGSQFTVSKTNGVANLTPHSGSLIFYNDYAVLPTTSPTFIRCGLP